MASGRTGPEIDKSKEKHTETEISSLWSEVKAALGKSKGARRG
jgi:hypothetical protein